MIPINDLLNKIKWDKRENPLDYVLGYEDRITKKIVEIRFSDIKKVEDSFMTIEREGKDTEIPLHRIKIVKKQDEVVWKR